MFVLTDAPTASRLAFEDQSSDNVSFNGNDAIALRHGTTIVDVIGIIGQNPGTQWGTGLAATLNSSIRRLPNVSSGRPGGFVNPSDLTNEWAGDCTNLDHLGMHENNVCVPPPPTPTPTATATNTATRTATPLPLGVRPGKSSGALTTLLVIALAGLVLGRAHRARTRAES